MKINEEELKKIFIDIKSNDKNAFEELYNKYNGLVEGIAFSILKNKQDTEDVTQSVFTKIYEIDKVKLPSNKEASWLYTTTKNEALTFLRKRNNNLELGSIYDIEDKNTEINKIINQDSYNRLISKLNNKEKEIISLKILANLSFDEISRVLNEPTGTIKWRYYKSIHSLKLLIANLAMFMITFTIGARAMFSNKSADTAKQEANTESASPLENADVNRQESVMQDIALKENLNKVEQAISNNEIQQEELQEVIIQDKQIETNYIGIGFFTISAIFLIISIIFFIKYQLKKKNKTSK